MIWIFFQEVVGKYEQNKKRKRFDNCLVVVDIVADDVVVRVCWHPV